MRTINVNMVRDRSYENFQHKKFIIRKFLNTKFPDLWYEVLSEMDKLYTKQEIRTTSSFRS